jgi:putative ABC transport system permease protein
LTLRLALPRAFYQVPEERLAFTQGLLDRMRRLPGVVAAGASDRVPLDGEAWTGTFHPEGYEPAPGEGTPGGDFSLVSPSYFEAMGIPLLAGRDFGDQDRGGAPGVLIVDEWTAKRFWPDGDAVGRRIGFSGDPETPDLEEIVGVVGHVRRDSLGEGGRLQIYRPLAQTPLGTVAFTVHTRADPWETIGLVRREVAELDAELPLYAVRTLEEIVAG